MLWLCQWIPIVFECCVNKVDNGEYIIYTHAGYFIFFVSVKRTCCLTIQKEKRERGGMRKQDQNGGMEDLPMGSYFIMDNFGLILGRLLT